VSDNFKPRTAKLTYHSLCITGALRIYFIWRIYFATYDVTWAAQDAWVWTVVETHLAIICASAPALKVFFKQYFSVSALTGPLTGSWSRTRRRTGATSEKTNQSISPGGTYGHASRAAGLSRKSTLATKGSVTEIPDIELGGIAVTREVEVARTPSGSVRYGYSEHQRRSEDERMPPMSSESTRALRRDEEEAYHAMMAPWLADPSETSESSPKSQQTSRSQRSFSQRSATRY
jgi:hypothetical protein